MKLFPKCLWSLLNTSRPQRRRSRAGFYGSSESLEHRVVLSAIVGQAMPGTQATSTTNSNVQIFNKDAVRVEDNGDVIVTAGHQANDGKTDRFELKTAGDRGVGGKGATQIWVNGKLAAVILSSSGFEDALRIQGSNDADRIDGSKLSNGIYLLAEGGAGNDTLIGSAGNDALRGDAGNDLINGGAGNDVLDGGAGNDQMKGEQGNDHLFGGAGSDKMEGGAGNDSLWAGGFGEPDGQSSRNTLHGGDGDDTLESDGLAIDLLKGEAGNDSLTANGDATLLGGTGNDVLTSMTQTANVLLNGGDGNDVLRSIEAPFGPEIQINDGETLIGGKGIDTFFTNFANTVRDLQKSEQITSLGSLIGLEVAQANAQIEKLGMRSRVVWEDGHGFVLTQDYDLNRVNLSVENGRVTGAGLG